MHASNTPQYVRNMFLIYEIITPTLQWTLFLSNPLTAGSNIVHIEMNGKMLPVIVYHLQNFIKQFDKITRYLMSRFMYLNTDMYRTMSLIMVDTLTCSNLICIPYHIK
jgi:hypothetical protein